MAHIVITIGREFGSGGRAIAQQAADALGIPFYDKALIELAAKETGLTEDFIREAEQKRTNSFLYNLYMSTQNLPVNDQVFIAESDVIRRVASEQSCVLLGRCADYVLREDPNCLNIFIHAPIAERMARAEREYAVNAPDLKAYVLKQDKGRASYYEHFTDSVWGKCQNYNLAISSSIGISAAVKLIVLLAQERGAIRERSAT